jgi:cyanophycin synthetase
MQPPTPEKEGSPSDPLLFMGQAATEWSLAVLNEIRGLVVHAGARRAGAGVQVWLEFHHAGISRAALQLALTFLNRWLGGEPDRPAFEASLKSVWRLCRQHHPDFQARILMVAAKQAGIPFMPFLDGRREWQFSWGQRSRVFFETATNADGALGWQWQRNKVTSKRLMGSMGLPIPEHVLVNHEDELPSAVARVGMPCVIKPLDSGGGTGVTANIGDPDGLRRAFHHARQASAGALLLEKHLPGLDHRLMVVHGRLVAAIQREASYLVGDGKSTVEELLARLNAPRSENLVRSRYLKPIAADATLRTHLRSQGADFKHVLPLSEKLALRSNANRSTGGICRDVTDRLHPEVRAMAEQLACVTGLWAVGIDYLTPDISQSPWQVGGGFIEINATPGMAVFVASGWSESDIGRVLLGDGLGRIPVMLKVVAQGQIASQLEALNAQTWLPHQGWVCGDQLRIGSAGLIIKAQSPWETVRAALRNRCLTELTVVCTRAQIERYGLPVDRLDRVDIQDDALPAAWRAVLQSATEIGPNLG